MRADLCSGTVPDGRTGSGSGPRADMAVLAVSGGEFEQWLGGRLDGLGADREVYSCYILALLQEEENEQEKRDALIGILSAFVVNTGNHAVKSAAVGYEVHLLGCVMRVVRQ